MIEIFMSRDEQINIIKKALDLYEKASNEEEKLEHLEDEEFIIPQPKPPTKPVKKEIKLLSYPEPQMTLSFSEHLKTVKLWIWIVGFVLTYGFLDLVLIIIKYIEFNDIKKANIETVKNSPQYLAECAEIDFKNAELQKQAETEYEKEYNIYLEAFKEYQNGALANYENEKRQWQEAHDKKIKSLDRRIKKLKNEANTLLEENNLLSTEYRRHGPVEHIYNTLITSELSIKEAVKEYEKYVEEKQQRFHEDIQNIVQSLQNSAQQKAEQQVQYQEPTYVIENNTSYSGGLIRNAISTAAGVAVANKLTQKKEKESRYKDFMGSSGCMYGRKKDGITVYCGVRCPLYHQCSRGRGR